MRRTLIALAFVLALPAGTALAQTLGAVLSVGQEVPPCSTGSGFGHATVTFDSTRSNINVTITVANLGSPITAAHIHSGVAGTAGNVELAFTPAASFTNGTLTSTFPITADLANRILQNPAGFYVNVHTAACSLGAARGQLSLVSNGGVVTYAAELRAQNEVPPVSSSAFGSALVTFDFNNSTITWEVTTSGIVSPTLSHIHRGAAGVSGPVIINFATTAADIPGGRTKGSATIASRQTAQFTAADLTALQTAATANGYYVNVHSQLAPGGEIRGQLVPAKEADLGVAGKVGAFSTDVRVFNPSFDAPSVAMLEYFPQGTTANTNATNTMVVSIPARGTATLNDISSASNLNSGLGIGGVRVSSATGVTATSRIFSTPAGGAGTFGQFLQAIPRGNLLQHGVLPQLESDTAFRTNVGIFNPNGGLVTVRFELRNETGAVVATTVQTYNALTQQQPSLTALFQGTDVSNQPKLTLTFDASAPVNIYAAVNDNSTGDSFVVVPQEDSGVAANQQ
jgi:hypothetical protein